MRMTFLSVILFSLILAACAPSAAAPLSPAEVKTERPGGPAQTAALAATELVQATELATAAPTETATPAPTSFPPHPLGCIQADLQQSVLIQTWSDRKVQNFLTPVDFYSGRPLCNFDSLAAGPYTYTAYSPDMHQLALITSDLQEGRNSSLQFLDLQRWEAHSTPVVFKNPVVGMAFSADGRQLAIAAVSPESHPLDAPQSYQIVVVDAGPGEIKADTRVDFMPRLIRFSGDGSSLIVYGAPSDEQDRVAGDARVLRLEAVTLEPLWETTLAGVTHGLGAPEADDDPNGGQIWEPAVVYAPQQDTLYVVHADDDRLTTVDFKEQTIQSSDIKPKLSWIERLLALTAGVAQAKTLDGFFKSAVLSADGSQLFVAGYSSDSWQDEAGNWQFTETPLGLKVIDLASSSEIAHFDTPARQLFLSEDGKKLFLTGWDGQDWTAVLDIASLNIEKTLKGQTLMPGRRLDGSPVLLSTAWHSNGQATLAAVNPADLQDIFKPWITYTSSWLVEP